MTNITVAYDQKKDFKYQYYHLCKLDIHIKPSPTVAPKKVNLRWIFQVSGIYRIR